MRALLQNGIAAVQFGNNACITAKRNRRHPVRK